MLITRQQLQLSINIKADKKRIWEVLLNDETYRQWTKPFSESSYFEGDWQEGSKIYFKSGDGNGLVSRVIYHKPYESLSLEHLGEIKGGVEDLESEAVKSWQGFQESYFLTEENGIAKFSIAQDITEKEAEWMKSAWEKALIKLKEIAEL